MLKTSFCRDPDNILRDQFLDVYKKRLNFVHGSWPLKVKPFFSLEIPKKIVFNVCGQKSDRASLIAYSYSTHQNKSDQSFILTKYHFLTKFKNTKRTAKDSNSNADQKRQHFNSVLLTARPRHFQTNRIVFVT